MTERCHIVAHRGYALHYPENTLIAFRAALEAGADAIEMDVQIAVDGTPVVIHDASLKRVSGREGQVHRMDAAHLSRISVHEPGRLGDRFHGESIPTLATASRMLADLSPSLVFIEIKRETLEYHQLPAVMQRILQDSAPLEGRRVIISFMDTAIQQAVSLADVPVGWVLPAYNTASMERARTLEPDFLFCDRDRLPVGTAELPTGTWEWAIYEVTDPAEVIRLQRRGVRYVETMAVGELRQALRRH
ncbi:MAG: glycerophosphodiester phosphodiesterase family protein [Aquisalimonadaceae bacterium]